MDYDNCISEEELVMLLMKIAMDKESSIKEEKIRGISENIFQERGSDKMELGYAVIDYDEFCEAMENIDFETKNDSQELGERNDL